jgi:hypothetical protein
MRLVQAALLLAVSAVPASAQRAPQIVIPGRPDVPVYINGVDASWGVVEGEFGLDRPGAATPTVVYRPLLVAVPVLTPAGPGYYPQGGKRPGYGRLEIMPPANRVLPPPPPAFHRSWTSESDPGPVTEYPPFSPPVIEVAPTFGRGRMSHHPHGPGAGHGDHSGSGPKEHEPDSADSGAPDPSHAHKSGSNHKEP